jgi:hypothetical protein
MNSRLFNQSNCIPPPLDMRASLWNYILYISPLYEFSHSLGHFRLSRHRRNAPPNVGCSHDSGDTVHGRLFVHKRL